MRNRRFVNVWRRSSPRQRNQDHDRNNRDRREYSSHLPYGSIRSEPERSTLVNPSKRFNRPNWDQDRDDVEIQCDSSGMSLRETQRSRLPYGSIGSEPERSTLVNPSKRFDRTNWDRDAVENQCVSSVTGLHETQRSRLDVRSNRIGDADNHCDENKNRQMWKSSWGYERERSALDTLAEKKRDREDKRLHIDDRNNEQPLESSRRDGMYMHSGPIHLSDHSESEQFRVGGPDQQKEYDARNTGNCLQDLMQPNTKVLSHVTYSDLVRTEPIIAAINELDNFKTVGLAKNKEHHEEDESRELYFRKLSQYNKTMSPGVSTSMKFQWDTLLSEKVATQNSRSNNCIDTRHYSISPTEQEKTLLNMTDTPIRRTEEPVGHNNGYNQPKGSISSAVPEFSPKDLVLSSPNEPRGRKYWPSEMKRRLIKEVHSMPAEFPYGKTMCSQRRPSIVDSIVDKIEGVNTVAGYDISKSRGLHHYDSSQEQRDLDVTRASLLYEEVLSSRSTTMENRDATDQNILRPKLGGKFHIEHDFRIAHHDDRNGLSMDNANLHLGKYNGSEGNGGLRENHEDGYEGRNSLHSHDIFKANGGMRDHTQGRYEFGRSFQQHGMFKANDGLRENDEGMYEFRDSYHQHEMLKADDSKAGNDEGVYEVRDRYLQRVMFKPDNGMGVNDEGGYPVRDSYHQQEMFKADDGKTENDEGVYEVRDLYHQHEMFKAHDGITENDEGVYEVRDCDRQHEMSKPDNGMGVNDEGGYPVRDSYHQHEMFKADDGKTENDEGVYEVRDLYHQHEMFEARDDITENDEGVYEVRDRYHQHEMFTAHNGNTENDEGVYERRDRYHQHEMSKSDNAMGLIDEGGYPVRDSYHQHEMFQDADRMRTNNDGWYETTERRKMFETDGGQRENQTFGYINGVSSPRQHMFKAEDSSVIDNQVEKMVTNSRKIDLRKITGNTISDLRLDLSGSYGYYEPSDEDQQQIDEDSENSDVRESAIKKKLDSSNNLTFLDFPISMQGRLGMPITHSRIDIKKRLGPRVAVKNLPWITSYYETSHRVSAETHHDVRINSPKVRVKRKRNERDDTKVFNKHNRSAREDSSTIFEAKNIKNETSEAQQNTNADFKQLVHNTFLKFVKLLNENTAHRRKYTEQGGNNILKCCVCGSHSKEFPTTQSLASHAFGFRQHEIRAEHLGLHKALCVLMGWNYEAAPNNAPKMLSNEEASALNEDLIIWPPVVLIHNSSIANSNPDQRIIVSIEELGALLRGMGFDLGTTKVCRGRPANQSIMVVTFQATLSGLREAEKLRNLYADTKHGRTEYQNLKTGESLPPLGPAADDKVNDVLYGYLGIASDLDKLDFETKKRSVVKSKNEIKVIIANSNVVDLDTK